MTQEHKKYAHLRKPFYHFIIFVITFLQGTVRRYLLKEYISPLLYCIVRGARNNHRYEELEKANETTEITSLRSTRRSLHKSICITIIKQPDTFHYIPY